MFQWEIITIIMYCTYTGLKATLVDMQGCDNMTAFPDPRVQVGNCTGCATHPGMK